MVARDIRPTGIARHVSRAVTTAAWYPHDTGMYLTGSADDRVTVWDPFDMDAIFDFDLGHAVHHIALSPIATAHTLVAAATAEPNVRLCDIQSGSAVQALRGHTAGVWAVAWSPCAEWEVVSASADGTVRVWDIRKALACRTTLDIGAPVTGLAVTADAAHAVLTVPGQGTAVWDLHDGTKVAGIRAGSSAPPRRTTNPAILPSRASDHRHSAPPVYAVPWGAKVVVADLLDSGERRSRRTRVLRGLMAPVAAVSWAGSRARLWTGGEDGMVVCWEPPRWVGGAGGEEEEEGNGMEGVEVGEVDRTGGDIVVEEEEEEEEEGEEGDGVERGRPVKRARRDNWSDDEDE
ncbi:hypothetical protein, variant [Allomyces macrogynus ATCC 38327]|nr:hypothetical protein, variant [Allomyces macrogynus ATCC 38327]|eukprot:KNE71999.1 hypothetical protein, variant [Allomyces macrogynus ATCC 38327]